MAIYAPKLQRPSVSDYYLVEWHHADMPEVHHYARWHYAAKFDVWNSWAETAAEAKRDCGPKSIGGDDNIIITGWAILGDKGLDNIFKELIYAGPNHV